MSFLSRNFGLEFEVGNEMSQDQISDIVASNSLKYVITTPKWAQSINNDYWHVKFDSTCGVAGKPIDSGWEIASFKASGDQELLDICKVANALQQAGCKVNNNCGFHIHADVSDFSVKQMGSLLKRWIKIEDFLLEAVPQRRRNNFHCLSVKKAFEDKKNRNTSDESVWLTLKPRIFRSHNNPNKRYTLNLVNYAKYIKAKIRTKVRPTIEFRLPEGTLNFVDIYFWTCFYLNFIDYSKNHDIKNVNSIKTLKQFYKVSGISSLKNEDIKIWFEQRIKKFSSN